MRASEFIVEQEVVDEYYVHEPVDVQDILKTGDQYNSERGRLRPVNLPYIPFEVKHIKRSHGRDSFYMFDEADRCVGLFSFDTKEVPFLEYYLQSGVKQVTPHMALAPKFQRTGLATRLYKGFLEAGPYVFVTKSHTEGANKLWDSLAASGLTSKYFYEDLDFAPRIVSDPSEIEPKQIATRAIRVLGPATRFKTT